MERIAKYESAQKVDPGEEKSPAASIIMLLLFLLGSGVVGMVVVILFIWSLWGRNGDLW